MTTILARTDGVKTPSDDEKSAAVEEWDSIVRLFQELSLFEQHELITELKSKESTVKIAQLLAQWAKWALKTEDDVVKSSERHPSGGDNSNYKIDNHTEECIDTVANQTEQVCDIWGVDDTDNTSDGLKWDAVCANRTPQLFVAEHWEDKAAMESMLNALDDVLKEVKLIGSDSIMSIPSFEEWSLSPTATRYNEWIQASYKELNKDLEDDKDGAHTGSALKHALELIPVLEPTRVSYQGGRVADINFKSGFFLEISMLTGTSPADHALGEPQSV